MSIAVVCVCGKRFKARDEAAGKRVRCPVCKAVIGVPARPARDSQQDLSQIPVAVEVTIPPDVTPPIGPRAASTLWGLLGGAAAALVIAFVAVLALRREAPSRIEPAAGGSSIGGVPARRRNPNIPVEVSYPIIKDEDEVTLDYSKRMVEVQLNMRVSKDVLREIALDVKGQERRQYERTYIFFYLPEEVYGTQRHTWATGHFNPTLDVTIHGLTKEGEEALRKMPITHPGKRIGVWLLDFTGHIVLIYENAGSIKYETISPNGARFEDEMVELPSQHGRRFTLEGSEEIHEVDESGTLRLYNRENKVFAAARSLK
jgi:hypothetical protein